MTKQRNTHKFMTTGLSGGMVLLYVNTAVVMPRKEPAP